MNHQPIPKDKIEAGETLKGVLLCPFGSYSSRDGRRVQVCDETAFNKVAAAWKADGREILCDFEHKSETGKLDSDTSAAAWISNLAVNKEGLVGDLKFTDLGAAAVTNRRLRFLSCVWPLDGDGRPTNLKSVALTNTPNIPAEPVLNKASAATQNVEENKGNPKMDELKKMLGLPPDADDAAVAAKVRELQEVNAKLNKEKDEADAEAFAEKNKAKIDKAAAKALYLANKAQAEEIVGKIAEPREPQTVLNKGGAKTPDVVANKAAKRTEAVNAYIAANKCDHTTAWTACRLADPELFKD